MPIKLTNKEKEIFAYFVKEFDKPLTSNQIFQSLQNEGIQISKRTIKNTLDDFDQYNKKENILLLKKGLNKSGGTCYKLEQNLPSFIILAYNLMKGKYSQQFFQSNFCQEIIKVNNIIKHVEENLNVIFDKETSLKIHLIIRNSPSALFFSLFEKGLTSQKSKEEDILSEEAEHEIRENILSKLLDDLRDKNFFISDDIKNLGITVTTDWKFKNGKSRKFDLNLNYQH